MTTARRRRKPKVGVVVLAAVLVLGVIVVVVQIFSQGSSSSGGHSVAELKSYAAEVPVPAGAKLTDETSNEEHGDANSFLQRKYLLAGAQQPTAQIGAALSKGDCRLADPRSSQDAAVGSALWLDSTTADAGDVYVLPPGTTGGGIELNWQGTQLVLRVSGGDVQRND